MAIIEVGAKPEAIKELADGIVAILKAAHESQTEQATIRTALETLERGAGVSQTNISSNNFQGPFSKD